MGRRNIYIVACWHIAHQAEGLLRVLTCRIEEVFSIMTGLTHLAHLKSSYVSECLGFGEDGTKLAKSVGLDLWTSLVVWTSSSNHSHLVYVLRCVSVNETYSGRHGVCLLLLPQSWDKAKAQALGHWQCLTD